MLSLGHVFAALQSNYQPTGQEAVFASVVIDSRQAQAGSLFVAFKGEHADGHDYVADAFGRGAIAALVEQPIAGLGSLVDSRQPITANWQLPVTILVENSLVALQQIARYWRVRQPVQVVGVTGSVGKSSTKELVASVLSQRAKTLKTEGNFNNEIGVPLTLLKLQPTDQWAVLEMGMYAQGEIALLCEIARPQIGIVTNVGPVHLERLGSLEKIVAAKQELIEALPAFGTAILNRDEPLVMEMGKHTTAQVFSYGLDPEADVWADGVVSMGLEGMRFRLHHAGTTLHMQIPLLGRHSVHTALAASAAGLIAGLSWDEIITGLQNRQAQLRLVTAQGPQNALIIDDTYNSSPESALAALNLLADLEGRKIAVLGDMLELGYMEEASHRRVGRRAMDVAEILIAIGKKGRWMGEEALACGMSTARVHLLPDTSAAISVLEGLIAPGDIILVKGSRGARLDQLVAALSR